MLKAKRLIYFFSLIFTLSFIQINSTAAQCPMCRVSAEQNLKMGGSAGKGLNKGILFMLACPYVIVSTMGFIWYKNRKKEPK